MINADLVNCSFLVYDILKKKWVNKKLEELLFVGATANSTGAAGLVPAPDTHEANLFLKGDGTWGAPEVNNNILTIENNNKLNHTEIIANATNGVANISGDIIIIKDLIANNKW